MSQADVAATDPRGKLILLVDDDEGILNLLTLVVGEAGFKTAAASSGEDAIQKLSLKPDAVIMDLIMPGCGGLGVLKHLKASGGPVPPVIVITAYENRHHTVQEAVMDPNVVQCLGKPMDHSVLLEALHRYVKTEPLEKKTAKPAAAPLDPAPAPAAASKIEDNQFFNFFSDRAKKALIGSAKVETAPEGALLFLEGDDSDWLYLLCAGKVEIVKSSVHDQYAILTTVEPGDYFGEIGVLENSKRNTAARAKGTVIVQKIPCAEVLQAIEKEPGGTTIQLMRRFLKYLRTTNERLISEVVRVEKVQLIGEMSGSILADLKEPLGEIHFSAQEIIKGGQSEATIKNCRHIQSQATRIEAIAQELREFSRGKPDLNKKVISLRALFDTFQQLNGESLRKAQVQLTMTPIEARINVDLDRFLRVLQNLVSRAVDSMGTTGGEIKLGASVSGEMVEISVEDSGPGIPDALRRRIFDPFAAHGKRDGLGLGLAIARNCVEAHGGRIDVAAEKGKGASFRIRLRKA